MLKFIKSFFSKPAAAAAPIVEVPAPVAIVPAIERHDTVGKQLAESAKAEAPPTQEWPFGSAVEPAPAKKPRKPRAKKAKAE